MEFYHYDRNDNIEPFCVLKCHNYNEYVEACKIFNREPSSSMHHDYDNCNYLVGRAFGDHTFHCSDSGQEREDIFRKATFMDLTEYTCPIDATKLYTMLGMHIE